MQSKRIYALLVIVTTTLTQEVCPTRTEVGSNSGKLLDMLRQIDSQTIQRQVFLRGDGFVSPGYQLREGSMTCTKASEIWAEPELATICRNMSSEMKKFPTIDGSCNNIRCPHWGKSHRPFIRSILPNYCDGKQQPRCAANGYPLPSARRVSTAVQSGVSAVSDVHSAFFMQWGQYISHDLSFTPMATDSRGGKLTCKCEMSLRRSCFNIRISERDSALNRDTQCIPMSRSAGSVPEFCSGEVYREQINQITSFIDASTVYGSSEALMNTLASTGQSTMEVMEGWDLLPSWNMVSSNFSGKFRCPAPETHGHCFAAGDFRVNETPTLTTTHLLWVREHNRIAKKLAKLNPRWSNRRVFFEARQIVIAQHQHITYTEYLGEVLGPSEASSIYNARTVSGYDADVDPRITNAFGTAAFRFGHSQVTNSLLQPTHTLRNVHGNVPNRIDLEFFDPSMLYHNETGPNVLLSCLLSTPGNEVDGDFVNILRNRLFAVNNGSGLDLLALNIQRGRDHGLPGYNRWRQWCGLQSITSMDHLLNFFTAGQSRALKNLYRSVEDIDLFVGGLLERPTHEGVVGATFACILKDQFSRLKQGDRFWFDNAPPNAVFSTSQVREIKKTSLAKVICNNMRQVKIIQPIVMLLANVSGNYPVSCRSLPDIDIKYWKDPDSQAPSENTADEARPPTSPGLHKISGWGGFILARFPPKISLWKDRMFTMPLGTGARVRVGETIFVQVGYDERKRATVTRIMPHLAGIEIIDCLAFSSTIRGNIGGEPRQEVKLIINGCPNLHSGIPISTLMSPSTFSYRFMYQNFRLGRSNVNVRCSVRLCFHQTVQNGGCVSKACTRAAK